MLTTILWSNKEDLWASEWLVQNSIWLDKKLVKKTWSEWVKALLYAEEWKNHPLAMIDITDTDLMDKLALEIPAITRSQVAEEITIVENNIKKRYEYLKKKCWTFKKWSDVYVDIKRSVSIKDIKNGKWFDQLDRLISESEYSINHPEINWDPEKREQEKSNIKDILNKDIEKLALLDWLFDKDMPSLLYMYRYLNNYRNHLWQFWFDESGVCIEPQYDAIIKNMDYFDAYMEAKSLGWLDVVSRSAWFEKPNFVLVRDFFVWFGMEETLSDKELYNSESKLQTILYRISTEVIGVRVENKMTDIKNVFNEQNESMYWLYFDDNKLNVNGNYFTDTEYSWTSVWAIKKIRADIEEQIRDGDLIDVGTWDSYFNEAIGNKYLAIIDQELARS